MEHIKNLDSIHPLESLQGKLRGKKVFLRADFNVPIQGGKVIDSYRIDTTMKTFAFLKNEGAITIVASHIETKDTDEPTLIPVFEYIQKTHPEYDISFCKNFLNKSEIEKSLAESHDGSFILFENIRNAAEEGVSEKKDDIQLAEYIKQFVDFYINDAFAVSHRAHTSVSRLPSLFDENHKVAGLQLYTEITELSKALNPKYPFVAILSGAKFGTKLPLIEKYIESADLVFVGGALYNNILKSLGYEVGVSLVDSEALYVDTLVKSDSFIKKIYIPEYVVVKNTETGIVRESHIQSVEKNETIQDVSVGSIEGFMKKIEELKPETILWNGPVGNFENPDFAHGTEQLGKGLFTYVKNTETARLILGGGDTVSSIKNIVNIADANRVFISTGGGAMLEFLEKEGQIPGVIHLL